MKKIIVSALLFISIFQSKAQTGVYKTYQDFVDRNLILMDTVDNYSWSSLSGAKIIFLNSQGKKKVYKSKQMWGFIFEGHLFRSIGLDIAAVIDTGKVCYYESGIAHINMIMDNIASGQFTYGGSYYLSKSLNSKYYDSFKKLCKENPEFIPLQECVTNTKARPKISDGAFAAKVDYSEVFNETRKCISSFNSN